MHCKAHTLAECKSRSLKYGRPWGAEHVPLWSQRRERGCSVRDKGERSWRAEMTTNQHVVPSEWATLQIAAFSAIWFASPFGQCRDVVPKCGGRVAHDTVHHICALDRADADGDDFARVSRGLPRRGALRYREPPPVGSRWGDSCPESRPPCGPCLRYSRRCPLGT